MAQVVSACHVCTGRALSSDPQHLHKKLAQQRVPVILEQVRWRQVEPWYLLMMTMVTTMMTTTMIVIILGLVAWFSCRVSVQPADALGLIPSAT